MKDIPFLNGVLFESSWYPAYYKDYCYREDCRDLFHELRDEIISFLETEYGEGQECSEFWDHWDEPNMPKFKMIERNFGNLWAYIIALSNRPYHTYKLLLHLRDYYAKSFSNINDDVRICDEYYAGFAAGYSCRTKDEIKKFVKRFYNDEDL